MSAGIVIGANPSGAPVRIDIEELLATRLLVQGNSGSGKSHLLRRLLEQSAQLVQQVVIDPEGDFVTLSDRYGHVVVDGAAYDAAEIVRLAARIRTHRASAVLALDGLEAKHAAEASARGAYVAAALASLGRASFRAELPEEQLRTRRARRRAFQDYVEGLERLARPFEPELLAQPRRPHLRAPRLLMHGPKELYKCWQFVCIASKNGIGASRTFFSKV